MSLRMIQLWVVILLNLFMNGRVCTLSHSTLLNCYYYKWTWYDIIDMWGPQNPTVGYSRLSRQGLVNSINEPWVMYMCWIHPVLGILEQYQFLKFYWCVGSVGSERWTERREVVILHGHESWRSVNYLNYWLIKCLPVLSILHDCYIDFNDLLIWNPSFMFLVGLNMWLIAFLNCMSFLDLTGCKLMPFLLFSLVGWARDLEI